MRNPENPTEVLSSPEEYQAELRAQKLVDKIAKSRYSLGSLVFGTISLAVKTLYHNTAEGGGNLADSGSILRSGTVGILKRAGLKGENAYADLVHQYEDQIKLAMSPEKERLELELGHRKARWELVQNRNREDVERYLDR